MRTNMLNRRTEQRFRLVAITAAGSAKIRMLLCFFTLFMLFVLLNHTPSYLGWDHNISFLPKSPARYSTSRKGYALLINTWKRNDLLKKSISHYTSCPGLDSIHIVWSEPDAPSDSLVKFLNLVVQSKANNGRQIDLKFDINKEDSLNNRFKEIKDLKADAVFSIDDDIIFPCSSVELAFSVWRSAPDAMVGFVPRIHWIDQTKGNINQYVYGGWWSVWWMGRYSMVLSKAAFFHKKYLSLYTNEMPSSIREYTSKNSLSRWILGTVKILRCLFLWQM
ncbi:glycosylinositol phosphorylceramide mannosyl transferase 1-like isoform X3 [Apium graveolens]|uniref:glycosylinositol phosphorylceramide mannosyl transferase 1-like isoform X3 n=1 Tax=Apium graveolens TaxID=4045 RepID=UPI003D7B2C74